MAEAGTVTGWKLTQVERDLLLRHFPPKYQNVVADRVTLHAPIPVELEPARF